MIRSLPLFHRIAGQPVIVLGEGAMAEPKRRLVERAGGIPVGDIEQGIGDGARLAFVALDDPDDCAAAADRLRDAGLLVNVVDRPDLCDFTTPSILDRDPVLLAIGTSGASAGLAKQLRLRFEALLPASLGKLAETLQDMRGQLRSRLPDAATRRQALDAALGQGGPLDPLDPSSAERVREWVDHGESGETQAEITIRIASDDPEDLTLREARLLGSADAILSDPGVAAAILDRARADAWRRTLPYEGEIPAGLVLFLRRS